MEFTAWLSLFSICLLGAISPGPSAAVIIQISTRQDRAQGLMAALGHGSGVGCYALLAALGLVAMMVEYTSLLHSIKIAGALFLIYLGMRSLGLFNFSGKHETQENQPEEPYPQISQNSWSSFRAGFLIALLNPKVGLFFLALFTQFVQPHSPITSKLIMAITATVVDAGWYALLAAMVTQPSILQRLQNYQVMIDKCFGVLIIVLALTLLLN